MRVLIQKVNSGEVLWKENSYCKIKKGYIFYIGIATSDTSEDLQECTKWLIDFINHSKQEAILLSQFTLFAKFKGTKPTFHMAKNNTEAKTMFYELVEEVKKNTLPIVVSGIFRECLDIVYSSDDLETIYKDFTNK